MTRLAKLSDISEFVLDGTHGSPRRTETGVPVLSALNVKGGKLSYETNRFTSDEEFKVFDRRIGLAEGDLLLTIVGTIGRAAIVDDVRPAVFQRSVAIIRPTRTKIVSRYLFHVTQSASFRNQLDRATNKSAQAGVYLGKLKETTLPLPSLEEQKRIAAILDQVDELRRKRQRAIDRLNQLGRAIFIEMFGDPKKRPSDWEEISFADACQDQTARSEKLQRSEYQATGAFPVVDQGQSFIAGYSDDIDLVCRSAGPVIVFGDHTRAVKYVDFPFVIGADGAKILVPSPKFQPRYFAELLRLMPIPDLGYSRHMREVKRLVFPCPPMEAQVQFAALVDEVSAQNGAHSQAIEKVTRLFGSVQNRAFTGAL